MNNKNTIDGPVYDARVLGTPRMLVLGLQHMFAMFGATVLVPALTGLDVATTLLFAGLGTLLFHLLTKKRVPAFLGSSFAFIPGYAAIAPNGEADMLVYACCGVACVGIMYAILSALFKTYGIKKVMRFFPPVVTGPIIIAIGLNLSSPAINNCSSNWLIAISGHPERHRREHVRQGLVKIVPILCWAWWSPCVRTDRRSRRACERRLHCLRREVVRCPPRLYWGSHRVWTPVLRQGGRGAPDLRAAHHRAAEPCHHGRAYRRRVCAISSCERNYLVDPGLHRTLTGDGRNLPSPPSSALPQTPPTARTPAFWPSPRSTIPA